MKIYLIGMPGSGKSTFGQRLSTVMRLPFIDTDSLIEESQNQTISQIFEESGEDHFRKLEKEVLHSIDQTESIISTGGGMPCFSDNLEYMKKTGKVVFLDVEIEKLAKRVNSESGSRPLLEEKGDELLNSLAEKRKERLKFYEQANVILKDDEISIQKAMGYLN
ncbi:MAG: shikimate kinase [Arenicella sp.]|jgi:shikimate kinase